jgi:hypothetical protein
LSVAARTPGGELRVLAREIELAPLIVSPGSPSRGVVQIVLPEGLPQGARIELSIGAGRRGDRP